MTALLLRGGRPWGTRGAADILVRGGRITDISPGVSAPGAEIVDISGLLVLPGLIDAHTHLDKSLWGRPWEPHSAGPTLADRIGNDRRRRHELGLPDADAITALLEHMAALGTTHVRTHTDVDPEVGLRGIDAVADAAARLDGRITVEQVAFPQHGLLSWPGTADLLDEALRRGIPTIGGIDPAGTDRDPVGSLRLTFELARRHGAGVDIHLHDGGTLGTFEFELICEHTVSAGLQGRVTISHGYAFGEAASDRQRALAAMMAEAGVTFSTCAVYSFPVPPPPLLAEAGVTLALGNDGIRDLWGPYGTGDMLERAMHLAYRAVARRDEDMELALHAATDGAAKALGLSDHGLRVGARADLVVVRAATAAEAIATRPPRHLVLKNGRIVARDGTLLAW